MRSRADETTPATDGGQHGADLFIPPERYGGAGLCLSSVDGRSPPWVCLSRGRTCRLAGWPGLAHQKSTEEPEAVLLYF